MLDIGSFDTALDQHIVLESEVTAIFPTGVGLIVEGALPMSDRGFNHEPAEEALLSGEKAERRPVELAETGSLALRPSLGNAEVGVELRALQPVDLGRRVRLTVGPSD
jgi:hypothetical protein